MKKLNEYQIICKRYNSDTNNVKKIQASNINEAEVIFLALNPDYKIISIAHYPN